ncbi:unnamed protein product [Natator depressus]
MCMLQPPCVCACFNKGCRGRPGFLHRSPSLGLLASVWVGAEKTDGLQCERQGLCSRNRDDSSLGSTAPKDGTSSHWEPENNNTTGRKITADPADWREEGLLAEVSCSRQGELDLQVTCLMFHDLGSGYLKV